MADKRESKEKTGSGKRGVSSTIRSKGAETSETKAGRKDKENKAKARQSSARFPEVDKRIQAGAMAGESLINQSNAAGVKKRQYTREEIESYLDSICELISEKGKSLRQALKVVEIAASTFYQWLNDNEVVGGFDLENSNHTTVVGDVRKKQYAQACDLRQELLFDEVLTIADDGTNDTYIKEIGDGVEVEATNYDVIQRSKLRIEARQWALGKMNPKKYGSKVEATLVGDENRPIVVNLGGGVNPED